MTNVLHIVEESGDGSLYTFLEQYLSNDLGKYVGDAERDSFLPMKFQFHWNYMHSTTLIQPNSVDLLRDISIPVGLVCLYGASRMFIDLLKAWVEERKGRKIRIRYGQTEIEIQGGVSEADLLPLRKILDEHFPPPEE